MTKTALSRSILQALLGPEAAVLIEERLAVLPDGPGPSSKLVNKAGIPIDRLAALTVEQGATLLGVQRASLYPFIQSGQLKSYKIGRRRLIRRGALEEFQSEMEADFHKELTELPETRGKIS